MDYFYRALLLWGGMLFLMSFPVLLVGIVLKVSIWLTRDQVVLPTRDTE